MPSFEETSIQIQTSFLDSLASLEATPWDVALSLLSLAAIFAEEGKISYQAFKGACDNLCEQYRKENPS